MKSAIKLAPPIKLNFKEEPSNFHEINYLNQFGPFGSFLLLKKWTSKNVLSHMYDHTVSI
jgi:hypothetical protein